jgi:hypothetical protein
MREAGLALHGCCSGARRWPVGSWVDWFLVESAGRSCFLEGGVLAAETTMRTRWGEAYQRQHSID